MDVAFGEIWTDLIDKKSPVCNTVSHVMTTTSTTSVDLPTSYAGEIKWVFVADDGTDLSSSTSSSDRTELILTDVTEGLADWKRGRIGAIPYYFTVAEFNTGYILPAPRTGGAKACEICHTFWPTWAAGDTSEPQLPEQFRPLISYKATAELREGYDMPTRHLLPQIQKLEARLFGMAKEVVQDKGRGFSVSGYPDVRQFAIRTGFRRKNRTHRSRLVQRP